MVKALCLGHVIRSGFPREFESHRLQNLFLFEQPRTTLITTQGCSLLRVIIHARGRGARGIRKQTHSKRGNVWPEFWLERMGRLAAAVKKEALAEVPGKTRCWSGTPSIWPRLEMTTHTQHIPKQWLVCHSCCVVFPGIAVLREVNWWEFSNGLLAIPNSRLSTLALWKQASVF